MGVPPRGTHACQRLHWRFGDGAASAAPIPPTVIDLRARRALEEATPICSPNDEGPLALMHELNRNMMFDAADISCLGGLPGLDVSPIADIFVALPSIQAIGTRRPK